MKLIKLSKPWWEKDFENEEDLVDELRKNICPVCLTGGEWDYGPVVDEEYNGRWYECRDVNTLLSTACGFEFEVEFNEEEEDG